MRKRLSANVPIRLPIGAEADFVISSTSSMTDH